MKVLHIGKYYPPFFGGIEKVNFDIVEGLNARGCETDVLCFNHEKGKHVTNDYYRIIRCRTVVNAFSTPISFQIVQKLRAIHKEYDIIHVHLPNPLATIALQNSGFKGKVVLHWHSDIVKQSKLKRLYNPFQKWVLNRADKIIVTSENYLDASEDLLAQKAKCEVIPIGIDRGEFIENPPFRKNLEQETKHKKVVFGLGRLVYYKGFQFLIEAAKKLPEDIVIFIGGEGPLAEQLHKEIKRSNLNEKVKLLGKIPFQELEEYYRRADVFCLPSCERSEAFGVVLIEAMSFGCPIVCCDIPGSGVPWVAKDGFNANIIKPKDAGALAQAIEDILSNKAKQVGFSENSQKRFQSLFQKELMVASVLDIYVNIL